MATLEREPALTQWAKGHPDLDRDSVDLDPVERAGAEVPAFDLLKARAKSN